MVKSKKYTKTYINNIPTRIFLKFSGFLVTSSYCNIYFKSPLIRMQKTILFNTFEEISFQKEIIFH